MISLDTRSQISFTTIFRAPPSSAKCHAEISIVGGDCRTVHCARNLDQRAIATVGEALRGDVRVGLIELDAEAFDEPVHIVEERHRRDEVVVRLAVPSTAKTALTSDFVTLSDRSVSLTATASTSRIFAGMSVCASSASSAATAPCGTPRRSAVAVRTPWQYRQLFRPDT